MIFIILAELVVVLHFTFIIFSVLGGLLATWIKWMPYIHIPAAIWGSFIIILGWPCPLTPLENALRIAGGAEGYSGSFIAHYLIPIIYPGGLTRDMQISLGLVAIAINTAIYICVAYYWRHKKRNR